MRLFTTIITIVIALISLAVLADEFTKKDLDRYQKEFEAAAKYGRELWVGTELSTNGVSCAQCHPNAANTHPETYPKFQKQIGRVITLGEMINWCIRNPLEGKPLKLDSKEMIAMLAYIVSERRGVKLNPGKH
ncbi:MAG: cytochrome C [Spirochaetota bacterium]|nr:cytochrome C [Spirochaetota bacterium]